MTDWVNAIPPLRTFRTEKSYDDCPRKVECRFCGVMLAGLIAAIA